MVKIWFLKILKSMALAIFQVEPVMELVAKLTENISRQEIKSCVGEYVLDTQMGSSLVSLGKGFITSDHSPLGELCLLLLKLLKS